MVSTGSTLRIVLADDDADDREFFQEVLETIPVKTALTVYKNGQDLVDALRKALDSPPDIVFLDLNMPVMNGIRALQEIRNIDVFKKIPVIAIYSTSTEDADQKQTFRLGADAFISKPTDYKDLKSLLQQILLTDWKGRDTGKDNFVISAE